MPFGDFDTLRPGERFNSAELNRLADAVEALGQSSSAYGSAVGIDRTGGGIQPVDGTSPGHWGKITGATAGLHSHVQMTPDGVQCPATADFAYGTAVVDGVPAREVNGLTATTGTVVWMTLDPFRRGWVFVLGTAGTADYDIEAVTDVAISIALCVVTLTVTLTRFRPGVASVNRVVTRTATIPSTCQQILTDVTVTMACVSNAPVATVTKTFSTVRVLACGACP